MTKFVSIFASAAFSVTLATADNPHTLAPMQQAQAVETIWTNAPMLYFSNALGVARSFGPAPAADVSRTMQQLFETVLEKPCPTNRQHAMACIDYKNDLLAYYKSLPTPFYKQSYWLIIGRFLGDIRSHLDPDYKERYKAFSGFRSGVEGDDAASRAGLAEYEVKHKEFEEIDEMQRKLRLLDWQIRSDMTLYCVRYLSKGQNYDEFVTHLASLAHLTEAEKAKLLKAATK